MLYEVRKDKVVNLKYMTCMEITPNLEAQEVFGTDVCALEIRLVSKTHTTVVAKKGTRDECQKEFDRIFDALCHGHEILLMEENDAEEK